MTREHALKRLFRLWIGLPILPVLLLGAQSLSDKYGDDADVAWSWLLMQVAPVLAILIAAVFSEPSTRWKAAPADAFKMNWAVWTSVAQGLGMIAILLLEPVLTVPTFKIFAMTSIPLALLQGVVVASVGSVIFDGR